MRWDLAGFAEGLNDYAPVAAFKRRGIVVFNDRKLIILNGFHLTQTVPEFRRTITLTPTPAVPKDVTISRIVVSSDGSKIILIGTNSVHCILVSPEVGSTKNSKNEFYCQCIPIFHGFLSEQSSVSILAERWMPSSSDDGWHNHLAILFTDFSIRIFSLDDDLEFPFVSVDFAPELGMDRSVSAKRLGMYTSIVSFDFLTSTDVPTILAVDSDGDVYAVTILGNDTYVIKSLVAPRNLPCEPSMLLCVPHQFDEDFSAVVIFTPLMGGRICHVIAIEDEQAVGGIHLTLQEILTSPSPHVNVTCSDRPASYLMSTSHRLFFIDIRPWLVSYGQQLIGDSACTTMLADSRLHTLSILMDNETEESKDERFGLTAVVDCIAEDEEDLSMFIIHFPGHKLMPSFLKWDSEQHSAMRDSVAARATVTYKESSIDPILMKRAQLPRFAGSKSVSEEELIKQGMLWIKQFTGNLRIFKEAVQAGLKRVAEILPQIVLNQKKENQQGKRMQELYNSLEPLKKEYERRNKFSDQLHYRITSLSSRLSGKTELSEQEKEMLNTLKSYNKQLITLKLRIPQLSMEVSDQRKIMHGPTISFQSSDTASMASIEKMGNEIDYLNSRLAKLEDSVGKEAKVH